MANQNRQESRLSESERRWCRVASPSPRRCAATTGAAGAADGVVSAIGRPEEGEIHRLYHSILDRPPDAAGFDYWVAARVEGLPLQAVADGFLNGPEYARRFGSGTDVDFVDRAYHNVLGRSGDSDGVDYWLDQLADGLARTELVLLFSESRENRARTGTTAADLPAYRPVVTAVTESDVALSWRPGCPVGPDRLRAVEVDHVDFGGDHRRGTLLVNADVVDEVVAVFGRLYRARYPIAGIVPIDGFAGDDDASMAANNSSAFNCRAVTGGRSWSSHSYGRAIDINPVQNPYVTGQVILPPAGRDHVDRTRYHPAMVRPGDLVTTAFADVGWRWGGEFQTLRDYQHFQR